MKKLFGRVACAIVLLSFLVLQAGCNKLNQDNYDRLESGMSFEEVVDILGSPDDCSQVMGVKSCTWGNEARNIKAGFMGGAAVVFSASGLK
jgi:hypothetical protein